MCDRIDDSYSDFIRLTGRKPSSIYLGSMEYAMLKKEIEHRLKMMSFSVDYCQLGWPRMKYRNAFIYRVDADNHLAVA